MIYGSGSGMLWGKSVIGGNSRPGEKECGLAGGCFLKGCLHRPEWAGRPWTRRIWTKRSEKNQPWRVLSFVFFLVVVLLSLTFTSRRRQKKTRAWVFVWAQVLNLYWSLRANKLLMSGSRVKNSPEISRSMTRGGHRRLPLWGQSQILLPRASTSAE